MITPGLEEGRGAESLHEQVGGFARHASTEHKHRFQLLASLCYCVLSCLW